MVDGGWPINYEPSTIYRLLAAGSASEAETQLLIAVRLGYLAEKEAIFDDLTVIRKQINALVRSLGEEP